MNVVEIKIWVTTPSSKSYLEDYLEQLITFDIPFEYKIINSGWDSCSYRYTYKILLKSEYKNTITLLYNGLKSCEYVYHIQQVDERVGYRYENIFRKFKSKLYAKYCRK